MVSHSLVTDDADKISCATQKIPCDSVSVNITEPGSWSYGIQAEGGPGNNKKSDGNRTIVACDNVMTTTLELVNNQTIFLDGPDIYFNVPEYANAFCAITKVSLKDENCQTDSAAFENSSNLISTLSDGYYKAKLLITTEPQKIKLCLVVSTQVGDMTVPNLELNNLVNCSKELKINTVGL